MAVLIIVMQLLLLLAFFLLDHYRWFRGKYIVLVILLILNTFFLPGYFLPGFSDGEPYRCGLIVLPVYFFFWIVGNGTLVMTSIVYSLVKRL